MKSNLQGRSGDRKGGFSPSPITAQRPAGAVVRRSYPRTDFVNCKTDKTDAFLTVKLDGPIPSDNGGIEFTIDSKRVQFGVDQPPAPLGSPPETSDVIRIQFHPQAGAGVIKSVEDFKASLPLAGKVFLRNSHPQPPTTSNLLDSVRFQLEQIRLNQVRLQ